MAKTLPERFLKAEPEIFCQTCDKVRKICRDCDRCRDCCLCEDPCELCGGYRGSQGMPRGGRLCFCLECVICDKKITQDEANYGYGLSEDQAMENFGTNCTAVCETCATQKRIPPTPEQRGFSA